MEKLSINIQTDNSVIRGAIENIEWAINQQELLDYILNFKNQYGDNQFLQTEKSNSWHLNQFTSGSELGTKIDHVWDSVIAYFNSTTEIYGYIDGKQKIIYLNEMYLGRNMPAICNTLIHEYCHMVGMTHSLLNPGDKIWAQTAPYAIGAYMQYMIETKLGFETTKPFFPKVSFFKRVVYRFKKIFT